MVGQRVNVKGKQVGSHLDTLKDESGFLQARLLMCSRI